MTKKCGKIVSDDTGGRIGGPRIVCMDDANHEGKCGTTSKVMLQVEHAEFLKNNCDDSSALESPSITENYSNEKQIARRVNNAALKLRENFSPVVADLILAVCNGQYHGDLGEARQALFDAVDIARIPISYSEKPVVWKQTPSEATFGMCIAANDKFTIDYELAANIWREMAYAAPSSPDEIGEVSVSVRYE